jgi:uncharacterized membrane protein
LGVSSWNLSRIALAAVAAAGSALFVSDARAGLEICNNTGVNASVAIGYKSGNDWMSEGWWNVAATACKEVVSGDLKQRYYYIAPRGDTDFEGAFDYSFCTQDQSFTITGDEDCEKRGFKREKFFQVDTGETSKSFSFALTEKPGSEKGPPETADAPAEDDAGDFPVPGNPFLTRGLLIACDEGGEGLVCSVNVDGWAYVGMESQGNPREPLEVLAGLQVGAEVEISGTVTAVGDQSIDVVIENAALIGYDGDGLDYVRVGLLGGWRNDADATNTWRFTEDGRTFSYTNGDVTGEGSSVVAADCPSGKPHEGVATIQYTDKHNPEPLCLAIMGLTESVLSLVDVGSGGTFTYSFDSP